jgi:hypothetical protein
MLIVKHHLGANSGEDLGALEVCSIDAIPNYIVNFPFSGEEMTVTSKE